MRIADVKLDSNGRARAAGEALGLAVLGASYPVTVRVHDGERFAISGPHRYDFGRRAVFDLEGAAGDEFELITFTQPGESFSAAFETVSVADATPARSVTRVGPTKGSVTQATAANNVPTTTDGAQLGSTRARGFYAYVDAGAGAVITAGSLRWWRYTADGWALSGVEEMLPTGAQRVFGGTQRLDVPGDGALYAEAVGVTTDTAAASVTVKVVVQ